MSLLSVVGCRAGYGSTEILHGVEVAVGAREVVAVLGPNGAGKSTLLLTIAGALRPSGGSIELDGESLVGRAPEENVKRGISLVPERRHVFAKLTVRENLELGLAAARRRGGEPAGGIDRELDRFPGLAKRIDAYAGNLSGGEQQQLAVARALLGEPQVLMLDEPSLGLAPQVVDRLFEVLAGLPGEDVAVLLVEQQARRALEVADRTYVLREGRTTLAGEGGGIATDEALRAAYLGAS